MTAALLVGGDRSFARMMRMALEEEGYAVDEVATGDVAAAELRQRADTVIVLLLTTSSYVNGLAVLEAAEAEPVIRRHAFVLVTRESSPLPLGWDEPVEALSVPVVTKPFRLEVLLRALREANGRLLHNRASSAV